VIERRPLTNSEEKITGGSRPSTRVCVRIRQAARVGHLLRPDRTAVT
jgi:hypothetical protein